MTMTTLNIAAACLLDPHDRLLLVRKRGTHALMLPGGKREADESPLQALQRELWEELQLRLDASALKPLGRFRAPAANETDTWVDAEIFVARLPHAVEAAAELEELAWLEPGEPHPENLAPLLRDHVLQALPGLLAK
nr:NUDIX domain-containing protein [Pseudomonas resinovorans]